MFRGCAAPITGVLPGGPRENFAPLRSTDVGGIVTVDGYLQSLPKLKFAIDFYGGPGIDPTGYGEGRYYLGTVEVLTDGAGLASFVTSFAAPPSGHNLTATATLLWSAFPSTSEFSQTIAIAEAPAVAEPPRDPRTDREQVDTKSVASAKSDDETSLIEWSLDAATDELAALLASDAGRDKNATDDFDTALAVRGAIHDYLLFAE